MAILTITSRYDRAITLLTVDELSRTDCNKMYMWLPTVVAKACLYFELTHFTTPRILKLHPMTEYLVLANTHPNSISFKLQSSSGITVTNYMGMAVIRDVLVPEGGFWLERYDDET